MPRILIAYASMAGSTAEVARAMGEEMASSAQVDVLPLAEVKNLDGYDGVVVGGPMIVGWHRAAGAFLRRKWAAFKQVPLAVFALAMSLTETGSSRVGGVPVFVDESLPKPPAQPGHLSFRERHARLESYMRPILAATHPARPTAIGVFGGRLEYGRLPWWAILFAMLAIQAPAGDRRNWPVIRAWAAGIPAAFGLALPAAAGAQPAGRPARAARAAMPEG